MRKVQASSQPATKEALQFRSAAVARIALMPVATLRVWEQRYQAVNPYATASGHRLYDLADVQRVLLLRQLTQQGHAISSLAPLGTEQLQALAGEHASSAQLTALTRSDPAVALRLVVVGKGFAERLRRPAVARGTRRAVEVVAEFSTLAEATRVAQAAREPRSRRQQVVDVLIWHSPGLQPSAAAELEAARQAWAAREAAVVYRFAGAAAQRVFVDTGALVFQDPANDPGMGAALDSLATRVASARVSTDRSGQTLATLRNSTRTEVSATPRRYDDEALAAIAALPSSSACECPRHVAELLIQIASFESYSADCAKHNQGDAELHAHLHQLSGIARQLFESAIEAVARHEGLRLR